MSGRTGPGDASASASDWSSLEQALPHVERVVAFLRRRHRLSREEAEDFQSWALERLMEDDCRRLRAFSGRSRYSTFLATVVNRLFVDYRRREWGPRWHPSALATRLGPLAVRLEELWQRDGLSYRDAAAWLVRHAGADPVELEELATALPSRQRVRVEHGLEDGAEASDPSPDPEAAALRAERAERFERLRETVERRMGDLPLEDRSILRMHYLEGMTIASVAEALGLDQRPLYRRRDALLAGLRRELTADGWNDVEARRLLEEWRVDD